MQDILWWMKFVDPTWTPMHEFQLFPDILGYGAYWNSTWFSQACMVSSALPIERKEVVTHVL